MHIFYLERAGELMNWNKLFITKKCTNRIVLGTIVVLLIPLIAMRFTNEVAWQIGDFIVAGALLLSSAYLYEIVTKKLNSNLKKALVGVTVFVSLTLVWVSLATDLV